MGDMADYAVEQGYDEWVLHQIGDCVEDCRYCEEENEDDT